jgi:glycosyltransferase involved in cell wall biosynthesis
MSMAADDDGGRDVAAAHEVAPVPAGRARVLFVTSNFPRWPGDSTTPFILHLARDLRSLGWDVRVLAPHAPGARRAEHIDGVPVERFRYLWPESLQTLCYQGGTLINLRRHKVNFAKLPVFVLSEWAALARRLARGEIDLVHSHWILPQGFTAALAAKPLGIPHIATVHGGDIFALSGPVMTACKRIALQLADAVTVNSSATAAAVARVAPHVDTLVRIPMGASFDSPADPQRIAEVRAKFRRAAGPLLVFVGRLVEEKGVDDLIAAVAILLRTLADLTALIVGDGQDRQRLQRLAEELGVADRVTFAGWVPSEQVRSYISAADLFVGPSKRAPDGWIEAQGLVFIESMLAGTPVIATASGGIVDAIQHDETGLLVPEASPDDIARAVLRLVAEPELAARLRQDGAVLARREFTRDASAKAFSELYKRVLSRRAAPT